MTISDPIFQDPLISLNLFYVNYCSFCLFCFQENVILLLGILSFIYKSYHFAFDGGPVMHMTLDDTIHVVLFLDHQCAGHFLCICLHIYAFVFLFSNHFLNSWHVANLAYLGSATCNIIVS